MIQDYLFPDLFIYPHSGEVISFNPTPYIIGVRAMIDCLPSLLYLAGFSIAIYFLSVLPSISHMLISCSLIVLNIYQFSAVSPFTISSMKMHGVINIQCPFLGTYQGPKIDKLEWAITISRSADITCISFQECTSKIIASKCLPCRGIS